MKILKPGKPKSKTKRFTCEHCKCKFEANEGEYKVKLYPKNETLVEVTCPYCKANLFREV